jgi:hypothetical protein
MSERGRTKLSCISVMNRMSDDPRTSYSRPGDNQKSPLSFQQLMEMHAPCRLSQWTRHLEAPDHGTHPGGKESLMIALRFLMTTHFPARCAAITCSLERLSSATYDPVRSSLSKILLGSENSFRLTLRTQSQSATDQNRKKRVESDPIQALSRVTSWRSRLSLRNEVPITMGFADGRATNICLVLQSLREKKNHFVLNNLIRCSRINKPLIGRRSGCCIEGKTKSRKCMSMRRRRIEIDVVLLHYCL